MPARVPLFQDVFQRIRHLTDRTQVPFAAATRFALLITGILAAQRCVLAQVAKELAALKLTRAATPASIARRLRRTLNDPHLTPQTCYHALLPTAMHWPSLLQARKQLVLSLDESSHTDHVHLLRLSLTYWGGSLPLVWRIWPQNVALPPGGYWQHMDALLAEVATLLPPGLPVVIVADRAYAVPAFTDRLAAYGWHWVVRLSINGQHRWQTPRGEAGLGLRIRRQVQQPGQRWKARGQVFKDAGWRTASVVVVWAAGHKEPLAVLTDLAPRWAVIRLYDRRFWIEPGFRSDKRKGWQWEDSQVRDLDHQATLLLALAWASLVAVSLGVQAALEHQATFLARRPRVRQRPWWQRWIEHARESVFSLGLQEVRTWLYRTRLRPLRWPLPNLLGESWDRQWRQHQVLRLLFTPPVRP